MNNSVFDGIIHNHGGYRKPLEINLDIHKMGKFFPNNTLHWYINGWEIERKTKIWYKGFLLGGDDFAKYRKYLQGSFT
jgi:hypothetical protein